MASSTGGAVAETPASGIECSGELCRINRLKTKLLVEILHRLPSCKSATLCKAVCKRWLKLIDRNPLFVAKFVQRRILEKGGQLRLPFGFFAQYMVTGSTFPSSTGVRQFVSSKPAEFRSSGFSLSFLPCIDPDQIWILASYKDLLLCCPSFADHSVYYLCNPLTKHWLALPPPPSHLRSRVPDITAMIRVGFVCDPNSNSVENFVVPRFKLVCIPPFLGNGSAECEIEIFSSEVGQWSKSILQLPPCSHLNNYVVNIVAYNGMLHWVDGIKGYPDIVGFSPQYGDGMISTCHYINRSLGTTGAGGVIGCLGVCRGRLRVSLLQTLEDLIPENESPCFKVWELKDYSSGEWMMLHKVYFNELVSENSYLQRLVRYKAMYAPINALAFHPYDKNIMYFYFYKYVASCNLRTKTLQVVSKAPPLQIGEGLQYHGVFPLVLPWWPTPVPSILPVHSLLEEPKD